MVVQIKPWAFDVLLTFTERISYFSDFNKKFLPELVSSPEMKPVNSRDIRRQLFHFGTVADQLPLESGALII